MKVTDDLEFDAIQRREVFALYGLAMYQAQCVEKSIVLLVSSVFDTEFPSRSVEERDSLFDLVNKKTLGSLLKNLRTQTAVPQNLDIVLDTILKKRNWLAHDYFWDRASDLLTQSGRERMHEELMSIADSFSKIDQHLMATCDKWISKVGVTQQEIEEQLQQLIQESER